MLPVARMGDIVVGICKCHKTPISTSGIIMPSQSTVLVNGLPAARIGDTVIATCGHTGTIVSSSSTVMAVGTPLARMGDMVTGCFTGVITQGSSTVLSK